LDVLIAHAGARMRRGLAQVVAAQGLRALEAADGGEALEVLLQEQAPRLALVDWDLPGLDGAELCRLVRHYHLAAPPYLILLLAEGSGRDVRPGLEAGANDCLRTPAADEELLARVEFGRRMVELPWGRAEAALAGR
jgi:DNA-binding response OmpR family regulator